MTMATWALFNIAVGVPVVLGFWYFFLRSDSQPVKERENE